MGWRRVLDAAADLAWGGSCALCGCAGAAVCRGCADGLRALPPRPAPAASGQPATWSRGDYADELRSVILACKERQGLRLVPLLAALVRGSAAAALRATWTTGPVLLVPIPSSRAAVAARGFDLTAAMASRAARELCRTGLPVRPWRGLLPVRAARDQSGLDVAARADNRRGSLAARLGPDGAVLLIDDIVTSGATLAEAARALSVEHRSILGAAVIAATPRRMSPGR